MIEKMYEFNLTQSDFHEMIKVDLNRTIEVCSIICLVSAIENNVILAIKKEKFTELIKLLSEYYKKYSISEIEILKDKMYLNKLKSKINEYQVREIENYWRC